MDTNALIPEKIQAATEAMAAFENEDRQLEQQQQAIAQRRNTIGLEHVKLQGRVAALSELVEAITLATTPEVVPPLALVQDSEATN